MVLCSGQFVGPWIRIAVLCSLHANFRRTTVQQLANLRIKIALLPLTTPPSTTTEVLHTASFPAPPCPAPPRPAPPYVGSPMRLRIISFSPAETGLYERGSGPRLRLRPRVACLFLMYSELGRGLPILQKSQQHGVLPEGSSSKRAGRGRVTQQNTDPQHMHR